MESVAIIISVLVLAAVLIVGWRLHDKINDVATVAREASDSQKSLAESITGIQKIFAGSSGKGAVGENIVALALSRLPQSWQAPNFVVGNKMVEFGVRLPNNLVLPIDSKLIVTELVNQYQACQDAGEKRKFKVRIHNDAKRRAEEIRKYLAPGITTDFGLAAVAEPLLEICAEIVPYLSQQNVVLVSYEMLIPYILLIVHMTITAGHTPDEKRLAGFIRDVTQNSAGLQELIQGRFSKAITMLNNVRGDMEAQVGALQRDIAALQSADATSETAQTTSETGLGAGA